MYCAPEDDSHLTYFTALTPCRDCIAKPKLLMLCSTIGSKLRRGLYGLKFATMSTEVRNQPVSTIYGR